MQMNRNVENVTWGLNVNQVTAKSEKVAFTSSHKKCYLLLFELKITYYTHFKCFSTDDIVTLNW